MARSKIKRPKGLTKEQKRMLLLWEVGAFVFIMLTSSAFHFIYELSDFNPIAAAFGSVNESTWEHLKLFFWPGLAYTLVQHAFVKDFANNYWWAKAAALLAVPAGVIFSFYFYLGIALPRYGNGWLWADISTGAFGILLGNIVAYRIMTAPPRDKRVNRRGQIVMAVMAVAFVVFTFFTPRFFLFEDFLGYEFRGNFGILDDYSEHLVFVDE
jgi:hypothetical protein